MKDLAAMEVVARSMVEHQKSALCEDALEMAIPDRRPPKELIHYRNRGVQYAFRDGRKLLALLGITAQVSRKGNCLDSMHLERLFRSLKTELVHRTRVMTESEARRALFASVR